MLGPMTVISVVARSMEVVERMWYEPAVNLPTRRLSCPMIPYVLEVRLVASDDSRIKLPSAHSSPRTSHRLA